MSTPVKASDGATLTLREARLLWEGGEFSDWLARHGLPLTVGEETCANLDGVEDALSDDSEDDEQ
jgi:hypothetical protein